MKVTIQKINSGSIFLLVFFLYSCSPRITTSLSKNYNPLDYKEEVRIFNISDDLSASELLGEVKIGDTGFSTHCDYNTVIEAAKLEARKSGGNAIKIISHQAPDFHSSCHRITAQIYKINPTDKIITYSKINVIDSTLLQEKAALIHFYRSSTYGFAINYNIYLGNEKLTRVKANWKETIKVTSDGYNSIWAKTESKVEIPIKIEFGREYYVRCGIAMGLLLGRPTIELVDETTGRNEFISVKQKEK